MTDPVLTSAEKAQRLQEASRLILEVFDSLDVHKETCECCGNNRFRHYGDRLLANKLQYLPEKLDKLGISLAGGGYSNLNRIE